MRDREKKLRWIPLAILALMIPLMTGCSALHREYEIFYAPSANALPQDRDPEDITIEEVREITVTGVVYEEAGILNWKEDYELDFVYKDTGVGKTVDIPRSQFPLIEKGQTYYEIKFSYIKIFTGRAIWVWIGCVVAFIIALAIWAKIIDDVLPKFEDRGIERHRKQREKNYEKYLKKQEKENAKKEKG